MRVFALAVLAVLGCGDVPSSVPTDADPFDECVGTEPEDPTFAALMSFARRRLEDDEVPGVAIAVARDGQLVSVGTAGSRLAITCEPITEHTRFSTLIGRHITAAAVAAAVEDGDASYDTPVAELVPTFGAAGPFDPGAITVDHALLHTSGYSVSHTSSCLPVADYFAFTSELPMWAPAGRIHLQLFINTTLAAGALGDDYRGAVRRLALEPLGMTDGTFDRVDAIKGDFASGYVPTGDGLRPQPLDLAECPPSEPYLGYLTGIRDAGRFLASLTGGQPDLVAGRAEAFYRPEQATRGGFIRGPFDGEVDWAYAGGAAFGYAYDLRIVPEERFGVVVFMNGVHARPRVISEEAIRLFTGRTAALDVTPQDPATLPALAGTYVDPLGGSTLEVTAAGDGLRVSFDGADPVDLVPAQRDNSYVDDLLQFVHNMQPQQIRFWRDPDGRGEVISQDTFRRGLAPPFFRVE